MARAFLVFVVLGAIGLAYLHLRDGGNPEQSPIPAEPAPPLAAAPEEPARPPAPPAPSRPEAAEGAEAGEPLPELEASDEAVIRALVALVGKRAVERFVASRDVVRKAVVTTDNLPQVSLPLRIRLVPPLEGRFATRVEGDEIFLSADNHARYADFVSVVGGLDARRAADAYARFYPLFQQAYGELGYPGQQFNDRLIAAIDDLLRAPEPEPPIRLERGRGLSYAFADPALESLSPGQKVLIRMGPANAAIVRAKLGELRSELVRRSRALGGGA